MLKKRRAALAGLALVSVIAATTPAAASSAGSSAPDGMRGASPGTIVSGAVFSNPTVEDGDHVGRHLRGLVDRAAPGSSIRVANFVISGDTGMEFTQSLLAARDRGVAIQVILDGWQITNPSAAHLIDQLGIEKSADSWVHVCSNMSPEGSTTSCLGTKGQHNKFYLFSDVGGERDVVVQSSANFTDRNVLSYWNNAVTITGNQGLYRAYDEYFDDMLTEAQDPDYHWSRTTGGSDGPATVSFFPSARDTVVDRLTELGCKGNASSEIRIGMSEWDETRIGIAHRLGELVSEGCTVRVIHGPTADEVLAVFDATGVEHRALDTNAMPGRIHSKYLIAKNMTGKQSGRQFVLTGSHNFNATSLHRNDEAYVELRNAAIYQQYEDNFEAMWQAAAPGH